ncbi:MAG: hypothetical protein ACI4PM_06860 [Butyricicoccus sp.]
MGLFHDLVMSRKEDAERLFLKTYQECHLEAQKDNGGQYGKKKNRNYCSAKVR